MHQYSMARGNRYMLIAGDCQGAAMTNDGSVSNILTLRDALTQSEKERLGLGHFNVGDLVALKAVIAAAADTRFPVLVGASEGEREFFGARQLAALVKSLREETGLPVFLNADHTHSLAKAIEAAKAGFDSVGI